MCGAFGLSTKSTKTRDYVQHLHTDGPISVIVVREALALLATDLSMGRISPAFAAKMIQRLSQGLHRKKPIRVAPKRMKPLTAEQRAHVRHYAAQWPDMSQLELAVRFNTNPGRISEALNEGRA